MDCKEKKEGEGTIVTVRGVMKKNSPLMTRLSFEGHGEIANETMVGKEKVKEKGYIPLKSVDEKMTDLKKYGGFTSVHIAYFFLVEHTKGKKKVRTLETVPIYLKERIEKHPEELEKYCIDALHLKEPDIRIRKIKLHSLIKWNGCFGHLTGTSEDQIYFRNAANLCLSQSWIAYVHKIEKSLEKDYLDELISCEKNEKLYEILVSKHENQIYKNKPNPMGAKLKQEKEAFIKLPIENQIKVLQQILLLTEIGNSEVKLSDLKEGFGSSKRRINKNVTNANEFILIHQSVTGIYESQIDLLKV